MQHQWFKLGSLLGAMAVMLGAFGAHALKAHLVATGYTDTYKTAVLYHFIHSLLLIMVSVSPYHTYKDTKWIGISSTLGILCFSGSLYLISTIGWTWLGPVTPVGGLLFILAWVLAAWKAKNQ